MHAHIVSRAGPSVNACQTHASVLTVGLTICLMQFRRTHALIGRAVHCELVLRTRLGLWSFIARAVLCELL
jgi:hypothetical protein